MKILATLFIFGFTVTVKAQEVPVPIIREISEPIIEKILGTAIPPTVPIQLSESQLNSLLSHYPSVIRNTGKKEHFELYKGALYKTDLSPLSLAATIDNQRLLSKSEREQVEAIPLLGKVESLPVHGDPSGAFNKSIIHELTTLLKYFGFATSWDEVWDSKLKRAIKDCFGVDCTNLNPRDALRAVYAKRGQTPSQQVFDLQVKDSKTGDVMKEGKKLTEANLGKELEQFSCDPEQVCLGISKLSGSLKFKCKGPDGDVEIEISAPGKLSFNVNMRGQQGSSTKFSFDTDGKIKFTNTTGGNVRGVTN